MSVSRVIRLLFQATVIECPEQEAPLPIDPFEPLPDPIPPPSEEP